MTTTTSTTTMTTKKQLLRGGSAEWIGTLARGEGRLSTASGVLRQQRYAFGSRFADEPGTNPEELIAAAHAGCYTMALAHALGEAGSPPRRIETTAELSLQMDENGPAVTGIALRVRASVDTIAADAFAAIAERARATCLVSRLLKVEASLEAFLNPE
jgi:osmotically inducible protein OsmC